MENEVVCLVTMTGEIVGRLKQSDDNIIVLEDPRAFIASQEGMGFAPTISMCTEDEPSEVVFNRNCVLAMTTPKEEIVNAWRKIVSGIEIPNGNVTSIK